ncbi:MAG: hypothetical protein NC240_02030 [Clostridium sp.]|nr:hypothetical protein [Clostridium sp.]
MLVNKKNNGNWNKSITAKTYILSVVIAAASVLLERVVILLLDMAFASFSGTNTMAYVIVDVIYNLASFFISFITIIIIFKLLAKCKITKNIWIVLAVCTVISIGASIAGGVISADISADISSVMSPDANFLSFFVAADEAAAKLNVISDVHTINRCLLVILSTWGVVKPLSKNVENE